MINRRLSLIVAWVLVIVSPAALKIGLADDPDTLEEKIVKGATDDVNKVAGKQGRFAFEIVDVDGKPIGPRRFIRGIPGQFSVTEFPRPFSIEGHPLFEAGRRLDAQLQQGGVDIFCQPPADADGDDSVYSSKASANLPTGKYTIDPFGITFEVGQGVSSNHPALAVAGNAMHIRTVAVTFRAVDAGSGTQVPLTGLQILCGTTDLLKDLVQTKDAIGFNPLVLYLPVGTSYKTSFGEFSIDEKGGIHPSDATKAVFQEGAFVLKMSGKQVQPATPIGKGYWLASQNVRRVFKRGEVAPFVVIASGQMPAVDLTIVAKGSAGQWPLGKIAMPAVSGSDSRLFQVNMSALASGKYELAADGSDAHPFAFEVVDLLPTTPLVLFSIQTCGASDFTLDSAGMDQLRDAGVRYWSKYGVGGTLDQKGLGTVPYPSAPSDAPPELRRPVSDARAILDDSLRHGLMTIDFEGRRLNWYNEGLAYHHSHPMTVDRMVRRVQIFGQELGDYPAFAGMSYTWFPVLGGYTEGGVNTDPFFQTRMDVLHARVTKETGISPLTQQEQRQINEALKAGAPVPQALADKRRNFWRAEQHMGFYDSFALYNRKLREVRPDFFATTACNSGHDGGVRLADMADAHDAMTWESYTDFGDWPMSAGFCADWAHGQAPGIPQWQEVESMQPDAPIVAKSVLKLARGVEGIGVRVFSPIGARANARLALASRYLERYGSLVTGYEPDMTVAVCVNELEDNFEYQAHALHSHLTRLGYGPVIVSEETIEKAVPPGVKLILIPNLHYPFSAEFQKSIKEFVARGGKIAVVGEHCQTLPDAVRVDIPLKTLWDVGGFGAHVQFWNEFKTVRPVLEKAMSEMGFTPPNGASPDKALILPMRSAGVRYVAVISSPLDVRDTEFEPQRGIDVKVAGASRVINLVTGEDLPLKNGTVSVNLVSEPAALLALLDAVPASVRLHYPAEVIAGERIELTSSIEPAQSADAGSPVEYVLSDSTGTERVRLYRLSGRNRTVAYNLPAIEPAGDWSATVNDLITGLTAKASIHVKASQVNAVTPTQPTFLPHPDRIPLFLSRTGEVRVIVEQGQEQDIPDAEKIVAALRKTGRAASIQHVDPGSFDGMKMRWFPTKREDDLLAQIDNGQVVGYRLDLKPYISTLTRAHLPEKGGWADIKPSYIVRNDAILFSGGRICESLRAVSDWMQTPNLPGKGQAVLEVALSPFWADRDALAIVSNDDTGRERAVDRLVELIATGSKMETTASVSPATAVPAVAQIKSLAHVPLDMPLKGFIPQALAIDLVSSSDGYAAVQTPQGTRLVSPEGKILQTLPNSDIPSSVASSGTYFGGKIDITRVDPAWHFPTNWNVSVNIADARGGSSSLRLPGEVDWIGDSRPGWNDGYAVSPDGKTYFAGEADGGFVLYDLAAKTFRGFPYDPREVRYCDTARAPRFITSAAFSPDGQYVAFSISDHPSGYGGLGSPPIPPYASTIRLIRVATGETVWRHEAADLRDSSFATIGNSLCVSDGAARVAMIDWNHNAVVFDQTGKELSRTALFDWKKRFGPSDGRTNKPSIRAEIARDGSTIMFATIDMIRLTDATGATLADLPLPGLHDARLAADGSRALAADTDGLISCFDRKGARLWTKQTQGTAPKLAMAPSGVFVAEGAGNLLLLDSSGAEIRRTPLVTTSAQTSPSLGFAPMTVTGPALYREPQTLAVLQKYGAKQISHWVPQGAPQAAFGRQFYPVGEKLSLTAAGHEMHVVHIVYRHQAAEGQGPAVTLSAGPKSRTFILDLPTPEYRVVDLPCEEKQDTTVTVAPAAGLEIADLSVYSVSFPGTNAVFVKPAGIALDHVDGLDVGGDKKAKADDLEVLDDKDPSQVAKASAGKMKNAAIFSRNPDPDQVEGHYLRNTGNPLDSVDGRKFIDGKPSAWSHAITAKWGSTLIVDLNHMARPRLCATYERTLRQSEVMKTVVILRAAKSDMDAASGAPDRLAVEPRGIAGVLDNDQFFNVLDMAGVEMNALGVYVNSERDKDDGLSEVELYE